MALVLPPPTSVIVDVLGFLTGIVLYAMLIVMVWRERRAEQTPFLSGRGRLPLLTGMCGLMWNVGALLSFGPRVIGGAPSPIVVAIAFGALGFLPAVVVQALIQGRATPRPGMTSQPIIWVAYGLSIAAAVMHVASAGGSGGVPSRPALWLLTAGFVVVTAILLLVTRRQPLGRRGIWVAALSIFSVSAFHFGSHVGDEPWWVELLGHHASLPLALAILQQDYRFALADLFLKHAIALLLLMAVSLGVLSIVVVPLLGRYDLVDLQDPRPIALFVAVWMLTAVAFPSLRRIAALVVDRVVLKRPDYTATLTRLGREIEEAESEADVIRRAGEILSTALGAAGFTARDDTLGHAEGPVVVVGTALRALSGRVAGDEPLAAAWLRLRSVDPPNLALAIGPLTGGRRLLSDDLRLLDTAARMVGRRVDALRVAQERLARDLREQQIQRLATESELRALRAQLQPHFLFNALTTVGHLIQVAPPRALETLLRLTHVLRSVLRRSSVELSTIGDEVDFLRAYLGVEQARFEERLMVTFDVSPAANGFLCPTLVLQPIVENAVRHGLAPRSTPGKLGIAIAATEGTVTIRITDSGVGFQTAAGVPYTGVGLSSVAQRLHAHFGSHATLRIDSVLGEGTTVEIRMPAVTFADLPHGRERRKAG